MNPSFNQIMGSPPLTVGKGLCFFMYGSEVDWRLAEQNRGERVKCTLSDST